MTWENLTAGGEGVDRGLLAQVEAQTLDALLELLRRPKAAQLKPRAGLPVGVRQVEAQHALPNVMEQVDALHRAVRFDGRGGCSASGFRCNPILP
jgi:hypothetical protein